MKRGVCLIIQHKKMRLESLIKMFVLSHIKNDQAGKELSQLKLSPAVRGLLFNEQQFFGLCKVTRG